MTRHNTVPLLPGAIDLLPEGVGRLLSAEQALLQRFRLWGYRRIETPVLERTELYLKKSGTALTSQLYTFTDQGGHKVSLRPEFTASVLRLYLQQRRPQAPVRWCYSGPVFRFQASEGNRSAVGPRQFTQVGAETIGVGGVAADAEAIALASEAVGSVIAGPVRLVLGCPGLLSDCLSRLPVSERARSFLLDSVREMRGSPKGLDVVRRRAAELGLLAEDRQEAKGRRDRGARGVNQQLLQYVLGQVGQAGTRTADEVMERYLRKLNQRDDPAHFRSTLDFLHAITSVRGQPSVALPAAEKVLQRHGLQSKMLQEFGGLVAIAEQAVEPSVRTEIDFGLAPEFAYYSGFAFEFVSRVGGKEQVVCSGGRYDGLARALGAVADVPACGFALSLERIVAATPFGSDNEQRQEQAVRIETKDAKGVVQALRAAGESHKRGRIARLALDKGVR
ncbi:MAG: ATP phosphoribosyltransferase regulatory subunit [Chloroflexi bacterium]|nr:ATP phosphoribosyltransferase regulatory subunit [Chloroflexota bacterium]